MGRLQKIFTVLVLVGMLAVILLTWGSIGSAVMTLGLLLSLGYLALKRFLDTHDPGDYWMDE